VKKDISKRRQECPPLPPRSKPAGLYFKYSSYFSFLFFPFLFSLAFGSLVLNIWGLQESQGIPRVRSGNSAFCSALLNARCRECPRMNARSWTAAGSWCPRGETSVSRGNRGIIYHFTFIWHELSVILPFQVSCLEKAWGKAGRLVLPLLFLKFFFN